MPCDEGDEAGQYSTGLGLERLVFLLLLIFFFFFLTWYNAAEAWSSARRSCMYTFMALIRFRDSVCQSR